AAVGGTRLPPRPPPERLDRVVERPHPLHGAVRKPLRERPLALVEPLGGAPERAVGVRLLLEHAQQHLVRGPPRRTNGGHGGTPRTPCGGRRRVAPRAARTNRPPAPAPSRRAGRPAGRRCAAKA